MPERSTTGDGDARRLASGSILQQVSQVSGLLVMLAIITVLARELTLAELGVYGLLASLAGYLLVVQNAAATAAVARIAAARGPDERSRVFSTATVVYAAAGVVAGLVVAVAGIVLSLTVEMPADVARQARAGSLMMGALTALGWPLTVYRDALRADQRFALVAGTEMAALAAYAAVVLAPALAGASLAVVVAANGTLPLLVGLGCALAAGAGERPRRAAVSRRAARELAQLAGYVSLAEAASAAIYTANRIILGLFKSSALVAVYEGPVRAQNLIRSLSAAITVTTLPAASRYHSAGDAARERELLVRGARYSFALVVPLAITGMALAAPVLDVWLGDEFRDGAAAMAILLGYWLVTAPAGVVAAVLVAAGEAHELARYAGVVAAANVALAVALAAPLGLEGVALATSVPYVAAFPWLLRRALAAAGATAPALVRAAVAPALGLGATLAGALAAIRIGASPESPWAVVATAVTGIGAYWAAYWALVLDSGERRLVADVARGIAHPRPRPLL